MNESNVQVRPGLEGVVVAETALSHVDGERGQLWLRGARVEELAGRASFEETAALLWYGAQERAPEVQRALGEARLAAFEALDRLEDALSLDDGMDALRAGLALLGARGDFSTNAGVTGAVGVLVAGWLRARRREALPRPDENRGHGKDLLRLLTGEEDEAKARAFEAYLVTVMDHGMNASTFTARVIASTGVDLGAAVGGAVAALKGPLHGGAPGPVLDMLDAVFARGDVEGWLREELSAGRRIMGMGHRVYRVRDPRAFVLERAVEALRAAGPEERSVEERGVEGRGGSLQGGSLQGRVALAREVERTAERLLQERHPDRPLKANVELWTALLLEAVGLPRAAFSPCFAAGRVVGWCAHVDEQRASGRLIRPASRYVGPLPRDL